MNKLKVDACFSPFLYPVYKDQNSIVVIIDILRATSAICTAFQYGVEKIIPVATIDEARGYKNKGYLVGAERDGAQVEGFEYGNSPYHYMGDHVKGKTLVITTTNGTQAIRAAHDAYKVVIGSFVNMDVLCNWLIKENRNILLLCAGWKDKFNLEDSLFAGAVTEELLKRRANIELGDGCLALQYLYQLAVKDPYKFINRSSHKERLHRLNLKKDIRYCLTPNQTKVIPVLKGDVLVNMTEAIE